MSDLELIVPLALIGIAVVVFLLWKMKIAPTKILPYIGGALAALFGVSLLQRSRNRGAGEKIKAKEEEVKRDESAAARAGAEARAAGHALETTKAETEAARAEHDRARAENTAELGRKKTAIDRSSAEESYQNVRKLTGE